MIILKVIKERGQPMEQKIEREWKSIVSPDRRARSMVMFEWDILSEEGRILRKTLKQIDCHNPRLAEFGGTDCSWACKKAIGKGMTRLEMEWLLVCGIIVAGIIWIVFYNIYMRPYLHLSGVLLFFGVPLFIGLILYYSWKMKSFSSRAQM